MKLWIEHFWAMLRGNRANIVSQLTNIKKQLDQHVGYHNEIGVDAANKALDYAKKRDLAFKEAQDTMGVRDRLATLIGE